MEQTSLQDFEAIVLKLASPEEILAWSFGEVTKPETINYRTAKPERDGLFDERIFGPVKDWECYCGKYRRIRYKGIVCDKCGVEVTRSIVRRERMGHIKLASPVSHIWFLRGVPSKIGLLLDISVNDLEKVIYFAGYIVTKIDDEARLAAFEEIDREFKLKSKNLNGAELSDLKEAKEKTKEELRGLYIHQVLSEIDYHRLSKKFGEVFEASIGAEALKEILKRVKLDELKTQLEKDLPGESPVAARKTMRRLQIAKGMLNSGVSPEWMFLSVLPIIPPDLRPMVQLDGGRYATSDLNDLYRRVINRNNRLKRLFELNAPEVITRNEKRMLQEAVDALIDNSIRRGTAPIASQIQRRPLKSLADILKGKQGRFRQNLLGKRVDYSGRSVIVVGPDLALNQCGIPKKMALELFKPFVIRRLIEREIAYNIRGAGKLIEDQDPSVWAILEEVIQDKCLLLNRAPTLHRLGIQAFNPVLIEGDAIQIHPMVCPAFNADFDGDQMAVHLPLTREAQREAAEIMLSSFNLLKPATGEPIANPQQDIVLGCYFATTTRIGLKGEGKIFPSADEVLLAYDFKEVDLRAKIKVRIPTSKIKGINPEEPAKKSKSKNVSRNQQELIETSVGRILFNLQLPEDFPYVNSDLKKGDLADIVSELIKKYGIQAVPPILDRVKKFGFEYATRSGVSWGINDLIIPHDKKDLTKKAGDEVAQITEQYQRGLLTEKERYDRIVETWQGVVEKITKLVPKSLVEGGSIFTMVESKSRGTWTQIRQMSGMKGLVVNPAGKIIELPVLSSYKEGLNVLEYFISTHGARKGTADTALRTSAAGYLTRRLVDVSQDIIVSEADCKTKQGFRIDSRDSQEINKTLGQRAFGRILFEDAKGPDGTIVYPKGIMVGHDVAKNIDNLSLEAIVVRSPITCRSIKGVCQQCYGYDLGNNNLIRTGETVGIVAAQAIGEPGTQLTMRTFHTGGVAGGGDITTGLPRVEEIFEIRPPKGRAVLSDADGKVVEIVEVGGEKVIKIQVDPEIEMVKIKTKKKITAEPLSDIREFHIPVSSGLHVSPGSEVKKGEILSEGHADLRELFKYAGREVTERYIIKEVQKIYSLQGAPINDKHIEVIVRQMFSRVRIKDVGDTDFSSGEVIEKQEFRRFNLRMKKLAKRPATAYQLLLGITRVALTTSSFLSAASFQETARILIDAAVRGRRDTLRGLKENVIIGRLIPAGTGYRKNV